MNKDQQNMAAAAGRIGVTMGQGEKRFRFIASAGMERFIGRYPRIEGICSHGEMLTFSAEG